ncbi:ATP-dependent helicase [Prevotella sp.]|uniref:ATP-dependent helicase n=1 Tax=Prevotella sp. TaxID=59823 RepID=UPI003FD7582B
MEEKNIAGILADLNDSQRAAVEYCDGASLVIAGAGSGKTRVLTYKVAYLLMQGLKPWSILALTFTNKAANEMKERINKIVGGNEARHIYMGTFHSIFSRILRVEAEKIGYTSNFTIYDDADSKSLIKAIVKDMELNDKVYKPSVVASRISMAKNHLVLPDGYAYDSSFQKRDVETHMLDMTKLYAAYCDRCRRANAMDFDDLLVNTFVLFNEHPEVLKKYASNFQYILVDEYQDTNAVQQKIVCQLASVNNRVCAVGDDAQSIYAFRGANIDNMLSFQTTFQGSRIFKLEQNYRSTQTIVKAANSLIQHNQWQIPKSVYSHNGKGEKLKLKMAYSDKEEAMIVCKDIKRMMDKEGAEYSDFAILYRTNAQSRTFEEALRKANMPYKIFGGLSFYQRKEIKDVIAYFRLVANPDDEEALKRIINYPARGIGQTTLKKITDTANLHGVSLWEVISNPEANGLNVGKAVVGKLSVFTQLISEFIERMPVEDAYSLGYDIIKKSGIAADLYADNEPENVARQENLEEFLNGMQIFVEDRREDAQQSMNILLTDFLQEVSLLTDLESGQDADAPKVNLMTIHSAKGLEFPNVFIVGMEENIFPSPMSCNSKRELEEERRLLYVAITRAEKTCCLTCARNRYRYGKMEFDTPSRFLNDINPMLLEVTNLQEQASDTGFRVRNGYNAYSDSSSSYGRSNSYGSRYQNSNPVGTQFRADPKPREAGHVDDTYHFKKGDYKEIFGRNRQTEGLTRLKKVAASTETTTSSPSIGTGVKEGMMVEHSRFGIGTVLKVEGQGENCKATVAFQNVGTKQLLMKFAKLKILK